MTAAELSMSLIAMLLWPAATDVMYADFLLSVSAKGGEAHSEAADQQSQ